LFSRQVQFSTFLTQVRIFLKEFFGQHPHLFLHRFWFTLLLLQTLELRLFLKMLQGLGKPLPS